MNYSLPVLDHIIIVTSPEVNRALAERSRILVFGEEKQLVEDKPGKLLRYSNACEHYSSVCLGVCTVLLLFELKSGTQVVCSGGRITGTMVMKMMV